MACSPVLKGIKVVNTLKITFLFVLAAMLLMGNGGCNDDNAASADTDSDSDSDSDTDTDSDTDSDTDTDSDMDAGPDSGPDTDTYGDLCDEATEAYQPGTTLCWSLCPLEQTMVTDTCEGTKPTMDWCGATGADTIICDPVNPGVNYCEDIMGAEFRLPTLDEILELLGNCSMVGSHHACDSCAQSATCTSVLGTEVGGYWSSSGSGGNAWVAAFDSGDVSIINAGGIYAVRCVRDVS